MKATPTTPPPAVCLLMDTSSLLLARGILESAPDAINLQIRITRGLPEEIVSAELIQIVSVLDHYPPRLGRVIHRRGDLIVLEPVRALSEEVRKNLRMPVSFDSFVYPLSMTPSRQIPIRVHDLSCGGIAFFASYGFERGEQLQIVIPITGKAPLLLTCQILRERISGTDDIFYAAKFVDLINDEEMRIREAVFNVQLAMKPSGSAISSDKNNVERGD